MASISGLSAINGEMEIRHLPPHVLHKLGNILDSNDSWKDLASIITDPDVHDTLLFSAGDIRTLEEQKLRRGSPTQSLLKYWGTYGRNRPTVKILVDRLNLSGLLNVARYVSEDLLGQDVTVVEPDISDSNFKKPAPVPDEILNHHFAVPHYAYITLKRATREFCEECIRNGGCLLGQGTFGVVFLGVLENGNSVAVKKLKSNCVDKQCITELEVLTRFEHTNLLPLLGYSVDGPSTCLVYEYLSKGSLQDCLSDKDDPLLWSKRVSIALGTARGINHLHVHESKPLVHRDIKSANILLDSNFNPKLGDFGLARLGSAGTSSVITTTVSGTSPYMSPEAFRGDVSSKMDVYSYGVVLLELLTGLPPFDEKREDMDLLSHVLENCEDIIKLLDTRAGFWSTEVADALYKLSLRCTKNSKRERPTMADVIPVLEDLCLSVS